LTSRRFKRFKFCLAPLHLERVVSLTSNLDVERWKLRPSVSWVVTTWVRRLFCCVRSKKWFTNNIIFTNSIWRCCSRFVYKFSEISKTFYYKYKQANSLLRIAPSKWHCLRTLKQKSNASIFTRLSFHHDTQKFVLWVFKNDFQFFSVLRFQPEKFQATFVLPRFSNESSRWKFSNRSSFRKIETLRIHLEITQIAILLEEPRIILSANRIFHVSEQIAFPMFQSKSIFQANRSGPVFELSEMPKATSSPAWWRISSSNK
jgi:hypothetical protein